MRTVAIDGPAGAGKSTLAANLAQHLGLERLDTGAMYRAVAWAALDRGIDPADDQAVATLARSLDIDQDDGVSVDGRDVTRAIRTEPVDAAVSVVAANPAVRTEMVRRQREWVEASRRRGARRAATSAPSFFPDADLKVYLTAAPDERAQQEGGRTRRSAHRRAGRGRDSSDATSWIRPARLAAARSRAGRGCDSGRLDQQECYVDSRGGARMSSNALSDAGQTPESRNDPGGHTRDVDDNTDRSFSVRAPDFVYKIVKGFLRLFCFAYFRVRVKGADQCA